MVILGTLKPDLFIDFLRKADSTIYEQLAALAPRSLIETCFAKVNHPASALWTAGEPFLDPLHSIMYYSIYPEKMEHNFISIFQSLNELKTEKHWPDALADVIPKFISEIGSSIMPDMEPMV